MEENIKRTIATIDDRLETLGDKVTREGFEAYNDLISRCEAITAKIENDEEVNYQNCIRDMQIDLNMLFDKVSRDGEEYIHIIETLLAALQSQLQPTPRQPWLDKLKAFFQRK